VWVLVAADACHSPVVITNLRAESISAVFVLSPDLTLEEERKFTSVGRSGLINRRIISDRPHRII